MENEKTLEELKLQFMQQYGITEEQLDKALAAFCELWEAVKRLAENIAAALSEFAAEIPAIDWQALFEAIRGAIEASSPPPYNRADTRNAQYNARLKGYKSKYMRSAAIRAPKRTARSCC